MSDPIKVKSTGATIKPASKNAGVRLKTKSVSFNVSDDQQRELYQHIAVKSNFSSYIKNLILRDMLKG